MLRVIRHWFDPEQERTVGHRPDYRYSLANERTFLAWVRTGLALLGGGLAVAGFLPRLRVTHLREAIAVVLLVLGGAIGLHAVDHWARSERAMRLDQPLPPSRLPAVLALTLALGALALIIIIAVAGMR
ncbi:YidH family protein [Rugosimonospora acidiphila]|uniref:YidH family protein n=1 Tax=Rugosimonospora acidiphila TaxID=556531 RepID=UPI0031E6C059